MLTKYILLLALGTNAWAAGDCEAKIAGGMDWVNTDYSPRRHVHPGFSTDASSIYYYYRTAGLILNLEVGNMSSPLLDLKRLYINYDPAEFRPGSYLRKLFGANPLHLTQRDLEGRAMRIFTNDTEGVEAVGLKVPLANGGLSEIFISRSSGKIFGFGAPTLFSRFRSRARMHLEARLSAEELGRGTWYNSNSCLPAPYFPSVMAALPDGMHHAEFKGHEVELVVHGRLGHVRYLRNGEPVTHAIDMQGRPVELRGGFLVVPVSDVLGFTRELALFPRELVESGVYERCLTGSRLPRPLN